jgi:hypothetical protein
LKSAPAPVCKAFLNQLTLWVLNLHHPSLRAKKYDEANDRWLARVNTNWRFYFKIIEDMYYILNSIPHPKK